MHFRSWPSWLHSCAHVFACACFSKHDPMFWESFRCCSKNGLTLFADGTALGIQNLSNSLKFRSEVGGSKPNVPRPGIQAQHPAPAPHARHDRSMDRNPLAAKPNSTVWPSHLCACRPLSRVNKNLVVLVWLMITMVFLWTWNGHGYVMFKSRYKKQVFVKLTFDSPSKHAACLAEY